MGVEIRRIGAGEWRELRDLRLRALMDAPDAFGSTFDREASDPEQQWVDWAVDAAESGSSFMVVGVDDGRRIGMATGAPHRDHPGEAGLFGMWVDPSERGAGTGGALVERVVDWAASVGFSVLRLRVSMSNDPAVRLYTRTGFADNGDREPLREGSDVMTMSMVRDLRR